MHHDPVSVIDRQLEAYNLRDLEGFMACYSPEAVLIKQLTGEIIAQGHAEIRPIYQQRFENPLLHAVITKRIVMGSLVIDLEHIRGIPGAELTEAVVIYQINHDLIERVWMIRRDQIDDQPGPIFDAAAFNEWADSYDEQTSREEGFPFEGFNAVLDEIMRLSNPQPGIHILDLGTGTGLLAARFGDAGCQVTGTDFSPEMLKVAQRKYPAIHFQFQDLLQTWPAELNQKFDRIVSAYVFHHFPLSRKIELIRDMSARLNPGGYIVIGDLSFETQAQMDAARLHYGEAWDEELYWVSCDALPALEEAGFQATYRQISDCAGVYGITTP